MKKSYVLGFAFSPCKKEVLLIRKKRPAWQRGRLNGVGGKIEAFDGSAVDAMVREFMEESGLHTVPEQWRPITVMQGPEFEVHVFHCIVDNIASYQNLTDEELEVVNVNELYAQRFAPCISNLSWLISLCLDSDASAISAVVQYS